MDLLHKDQSLLQQSVKRVIGHRLDTVVLICDATGMIQEAHGTVEQTFGFNQNELVGQSPNNLINACSALLSFVTANRSPSDDTPVAEHRLRGFRKDGEAIEINLQIWQLENNTEQYLLHISTDETNPLNPSAPTNSTHSGEHLLQIFQALPIGIFECDTLGRIRYCNDSFSNILGYQGVELRGKTLWDLSANEVELTKLHHYCNDISTKAPPAINIKFITRNRQTISVQLVLVYVRDKLNIIQGISGSASAVPSRNDHLSLGQSSKEELRELLRERALVVKQTSFILEEQIKEHSQTAENLRKTNHILESVFTHTPIRIAYLDHELNFVTANRAFIEGFILDRKPINGRNITDVPALRKRSGLLRQVLEENSKRYFYREHFPRQNGADEPVYFDWSVICVHNEKTEPAGLLLAFDDVTDYVTTQTEKQRAQEHLTSIVNNVPIILFAIAADGTVALAAGKGLDNIGINSEHLLGKNILSCFSSQGTLIKNMERAIAGEEFSAIETIGDRIFEFCYQPGIMRDNGQHDITGIATDITDLKLTEQQLLSSRTLLAEAQKIAHLGNWTCQWHASTGLLSQYWSNELYHITGLDKKRHPPDHATYMNLVHEDDRNRLETALADSYLRCEAYTVDYRLIRPDGQERIFQERGIARPVQHSDAVSIHGTVQDITERRRAEQFVLKMTNFDILTGLPNRNLLQQQLQRAISQGHRNKRMVALLTLDLDNFKGINESLGHNHGDQLLREVGNRLQQALRAEDTIARLSGDEFCIIMEDLRASNDIAWMIQNIRKTLKDKYQLGKHEIFCSACIGISVYPADAGDSEEILQHSQSALRRAREQGRNTYQYFTTDMNTQALEHLLYENALRYALERDELELHYQPQVDLVSGKVAGFEALLRWRHPDMGLISPDQFIPLAEKTGLIIPIGLWAIRTACQQLRYLQQCGMLTLSMSVNMSPQQVFQPGIAHDIEGILREVGLAPEFLKLELTESSLLEDSARTRMVLNRLHQLGVRISIDDFGTGYSSLGYLKRIPLDTLKIDRSFIQDLTQNSDDAAISQAIIALAKSLNIRVIAEGVENVEQWRFLEAQHCDEIQGNFISEPLAKEPMLHWLQHYGQISVLLNERITGAANRI